jgi:pyruvate formate lyase activating enzyme
MMKRREFITRLTGACLASAALPRGLGLGGPAARAQDAVDFELPRGEREVGIAPARHYERLAEKKVVCKLCPRECVVADQERGYCGVRENHDGEFVTLVHGRVCAAHVDPIEKKPFYHVLPGSGALSIAAPGCNMKCRFCQNWQISQFRPEQVGTTAAPVEGLLQVARQRGAATLAYTYTEPTIFYEYMLDAARYTAPRGLRNLVVSNGYIQAAPVRELAPFLTAYKVDLKAYTNDFYRNQCSAELAPVLRTLLLLRELEVWTEIVILILPTLNDDESSNRAMFEWIVSELGPEVPVHLSRFHPTYKIQNLPRTPIATLEHLHALARASGLHYVYIGNAQGHRAESTYCPACDTQVIERFGHLVGSIRMRDGCCRQCGHPIPGVWS